MIAALATLAAAAVLAQAAAPATASPAMNASAATKDPVVCKSETPIGSRLPQKTCMLKSERERMRRESQKRLQDIQTAGRGPFKTD
jgi:hypothetical protein